MDQDSRSYISGDSHNAASLPSLSPNTGWVNKAKIYNSNAVAMRTADSNRLCHLPGMPAANSTVYMEMFRGTGHLYSPRYVRGSNLSSSPADYAARMSARASAKPKVIGFDSRKIIPMENQVQVRGVVGFFPPVKRRMSPSDYRKHQHKTKRRQSPQVVLELLPQASRRSPSPHRATSSRSRSTVSRAESIRSKYMSQPPVYPNLLTADSQLGDDISALPRPNMIISRGDLPWVYRYKVKQSMNQLSKIMASRAPPVVPAFAASQ